MAQVTIYLPDELAERLRREAKKAGTSLSGYIASIANRKPGRTGRWPVGFEKLYGSWEGEFPEIEELPPDQRESWG
jgi:hypothetical protein